MKLGELADLTGARVEPPSSNAEPNRSEKKPGSSISGRGPSSVEVVSADLELTGAAGLDDATHGQVTFLANPRYTPRVKTTKASAIYLGEDVDAGRNDIVILRAKDPYLAYTRALRLFHPEPEVEPSIHPTAVIDSTAKIAEDVWIGPNVVIGPRAQISGGVRIYPNVTIYEDVSIGSDSIVHAGSVIRERTIIGERVVIYNNVVVGCDGFGYAKDEQKRWLKIPQTGRVVIEDDVEIGAGTTIDRASVGESRIGRGTKIDNLVQIGHSCTVGEDTLLCAQVGLAGSSHIGDRVVLAGQAGVAGHLKIGNDVVLTAKSATSHDVPDGKVISGIPAFDNKDWLRATAAFRRLAEMQRTIRELKQRLLAIDKENDPPKITKGH